MQHSTPSSCGVGRCHGELHPANRAHWYWYEVDLANNNRFSGFLFCGLRLIPIILSGVESLHDIGFGHTDIKLNNAFVDCSILWCDSAVQCMVSPSNSVASC